MATRCCDLSLMNPYARKSWLNKILRAWIHFRLLVWSGTVIMAGPFKGMRYIDRSINSALFPKLLGTYESEIAPFLDKLKCIRPHTLINIGAGEGYYAV